MIMCIYGQNKFYECSRTKLYASITHFFVKFKPTQIRVCGESELNREILNFCKECLIPAVQVEPSEFIIGADYFVNLGRVLNSKEVEFLEKSRLEYVMVSI